MTTWPTLAQVKAELRLGDDPTEDEVLERARLGAIDYCTGRVNPKWIVIDPMGDQIPDGVYEAAMFASCRYYRRRDSLDGTIGWGEMGVIRVGSRDPDVDALMGRYLAVVFA